MLLCVFITGQVYFTYNGQRLRACLDNVSGAMYPVVHIQKKVPLVFRLHCQSTFVISFSLSVDFCFKLSNCIIFLLCVVTEQARLFSLYIK